MDIGPIPFTAIVEYSKIYGLSDFESFEDFAYIIRRMDTTFLNLKADRADKNPKGGEKSASTNADKKNSNQGGHGR